MFDHVGFDCCFREDNGLGPKTLNTMCLEDFRDFRVFYVFVAFVAFVAIMCEQASCRCAAGQAEGHGHCSWARERASRWSPQDPKQDTWIPRNPIGVPRVYIRGPYGGHMGAYLLTLIVTHIRCRTVSYGIVRYRTVL